MSGEDLTRWNRAGLERFRYVDGNAPLWLERLRRELRQAFDAEQGSEPASHIHLGALGPVDFPDEVVGDHDTEAQRSEKRIRRMNRLLKNYHGERGDWGWEIARSFARACHVLTEHMDAYANEGFLGTATQWDNVRQMVEMLGYSPAPPASASTRLALVAKTGVVEKVAAGLQAKYAPPEGGDAIVFETLEDLHVDVALNEVRLKDWNVNQQLLDSDPFFELDGAELSSGQRGVLVGRPNGVEDAVDCEIGEVGDTYLTLADCPPVASDWKKGETILLAGPKLHRRLRLNGTGAIAFDKPHGLGAGSAIAWQYRDENNKWVWVFGRVKEADQTSVLLDGGQQPAANTDVYPVVRIGRNTESRLLFPVAAKDLPISKSNSGKLIRPATKKYVLDATGKKVDSGTTTAYEVTDDSNEIFLVNGFDRKIGAVVSPQEGYLLDGDSAGLASGQWVIAMTGKGRQALRIDTLTSGENDSTVLTLKDASGNEFKGRIISISGVFKYTLQPRDAAINAESVPCDGESEMTLQLNQPDDNALSAYLTPGRRIIVEQKSGDECSNAVEATVQKYEAGKLTFSPSLNADAGFTFHNTVIRGNVVSAGHGAQQDEKVLGSGDATLSGQRFVLSAQGVSFVADSTMSAGVAAAVDVIVAGRIWKQVSGLSDSGPEDDHYAVRMTEDGYIAVLFGDGSYGRRLPTGNNNVRIRYRQGTGSKGNVAARSLCKLAKPHRFVDGVSQPLPALLGNDMEDMASLRDQAAAGLLTLGRAVSISDFAELAAGHSSIWQARSYVGAQGFDRRNSVHVTMVPAYGTKLGGLKSEIQDFLQAHAIPGTRVVVHDFVPQYLCLNVRVFVKSAAFAPGLVMDRVRADLIQAFALKRRKLGQSIYLSEVYEIVEAVQGVEYSRCILGQWVQEDDEKNRHIAWQQEAARSQEISATDDEVIFIDESKSRLLCSYEEFEL